MGYPRLEVGKQCELAPTLLTAMEGKPQPQQDRWGGFMHSNTLGCIRIFTIITMQDLKKKKNVCQIHVSLPQLAHV